MEQANLHWSEFDQFLIKCGDEMNKGMMRYVLQGKRPEGIEVQGIDITQVIDRVASRRICTARGNYEVGVLYRKENPDV